MRTSMRLKLTVSLVAVSLLAGSVSLLVGGQLLYSAVLREATNRVRQDLNAAREMYLARTRNTATALQVTALGRGFQADLARRDGQALQQRLRQLAGYARLDFAGVLTADGNLWCRLDGEPGPWPAAPASHPLTELVRARGAAVAGTVVLSPDDLAREDPALAERARIRLLPTPRAVPRPEAEDATGLAIAAAVPVGIEGQAEAVLYGGILLNRNTEIVDTVRDTVFQNEVYRGRGIGTATIFLADHRIATNVLAADGQRAVGTQVSREVGDRVLRQGGTWSGRAFVVHDWYVSAYEPIRDLAGRTVGMLYVGVLEGKYVDLRRRILLLLLLFTAAGTALAIALGWALAHRTLRPVDRLIAASVGLMLVVIAGAELFTGNNLMISSAMSGEITYGVMLKRWGLVYVANLLGAVLVALLFCLSGLWKTGDGALGAAALKVACTKVSLPFGEALVRAIGCNWLVCLAVWMALAARHTVGKIFAIFFPIMAFVAIGFEHCIANMYFIPAGLLLRDLAGLAAPADFAPGALSWLSFAWSNLVPVTLGNIIGGGVFVGMSYWSVYLRPAKT
jgi:formate/nitrite transporter